MSPLQLDSPLAPTEQVKVLSKVKRAAVSTKLNFSDVANFVGDQLTSHPSRDAAANPLKSIAARGHIASKQLSEAQFKMPYRTDSAATTAYTSGQSFTSKGMPSRKDPRSAPATTTQDLGAGRFAGGSSAPATTTQDLGAGRFAGGSHQTPDSPPSGRSHSATAGQEVSMARTHSLRQRLDWLHTERRMRRDRLRTVDNLISEETLEQRRIGLKVEKHKAEQQFHYEKVWDLERQISNIRGELHQAMPRGMVRSYSEGFARQTQPPTKPMARSDGFKSGFVPVDPDDFLADDHLVAELPKIRGATGEYDSRANKFAGTASSFSSGLEASSSMPSLQQPGSKDRTGSKDRSRPSTSEGLRELQNISTNISEEMDKLCGRLEMLEDRHMLSNEDRATEELMYALACDEAFEKEDDLLPLIASAQDALSDDSEGAEERKRSVAGRRSNRRGTEIDQKRDLIRLKMIESCGSEFKAYKSLDYNLNGEVSITEFTDGLDRLKVPWREITGFKSRNDLFKLFDVDESGSLDLREIFPEEAARQAAPKRVSTPEAWHHWVKNNRDCTGKSRPAMWVRDIEGNLADLMTSQKSTDKVIWKRRWMKETMRRLKHNGKSDARCRELCAHHLPRGQGPKDIQGVNTFTAADFRACRRSYNEKLQRPVRKIQKVVYDLRAQRRDLNESRHKLYAITEAVQKKKAEEERKKRLAEGIMLGGGADDGGSPGRKAQFDKIRQGVQQETQQFEVDESSLSEADRRQRELSRKYSIPVNDVEYIYKQFKKFDSAGSGCLCKADFGKLLGKLIAQNQSSSELDGRWNEVVKMQIKGLHLPEGQGKEEAIDFERFLVWFWVNNDELG